MEQNDPDSTCKAMMDELAFYQGEIAKMKQQAPGRGTSTRGVGRARRGRRAGRVLPVASHHRTLINVPPASAASKRPADEEPSTEVISTSAVSSATSYIRRGHKLVRVGVQEPKRKTIPRVKASTSSKLINVEGKTYRRTHRQLVAVQGDLRQDEKGKSVLSLGGTEFIMNASGHKLVRKGLAPQQKTPRRVLIGGQEFIRTRKGNLIRASARKTQRRFKIASIQQERSDCLHYNRYGYCRKDGNKCRRIHDPSRVAICPLFFHHRCTKTSSLPDELLTKSPDIHDLPRPLPRPKNHECPGSHTLTKTKMALCSFFGRGQCQKGAECPFHHVKMNPLAPVCEAFAYGLYCPLGVPDGVNKGCDKRHVYECPQWVFEGKCDRLEDKKKCNLAHPKRFGKSTEDPSGLQEPAQLQTSASKPSHSRNFWSRSDIAKAAAEQRRDEDIEQGNFMPFDFEDDVNDEESDEDSEADLGSSQSEEEFVSLSEGEDVVSENEDDRVEDVDEESEVVWRSDDPEKDDWI